MRDNDRWWDLNNVYRYRNENLERMGFKTYRAYLQSDLWQAIRQQVLDRAQGMCERCNKRKAHQVHHRAYDPATLKGENLNALTAACFRCHHRAERPEDRFQKANDRLHRANKTMLRGWRRSAVRLVKAQ